MTSGRPGPPVRPVFVRRADGVLDVDLGPGWQGLTEALSDAVGTRAPAGSSGANPSGYWLDAALVALRSAPGEGPWAVASGNHTQLVRMGEDVVATSMYELWESQTMPVPELVRVLTHWRLQVGQDGPPEDGYDLELRWKEQVVYREDEREHAFEAAWGVQPPVLFVPTEADWDRVVPPWLRGRRPEVVDRLARRSGHEVRDDTSLRGSADGR